MRSSRLGEQSDVHLPFRHGSVVVQDAQNEQLAKARGVNSVEFSALAVAPLRSASAAGECATIPKRLEGTPIGEPVRIKGGSSIGSTLLRGCSDMLAPHDG